MFNINNNCNYQQPECKNKNLNVEEKDPEGEFWDILEGYNRQDLEEEFCDISDISVVKVPGSFSDLNNELIECNLNTEERTEVVNESREEIIKKESGILNSAEHEEVLSNNNNSIREESKDIFIDQDSEEHRKYLETLVGTFMDYMSRPEHDIHKLVFYMAENPQEIVNCICKDYGVSENFIWGFMDTLWAQIVKEQTDTYKVNFTFSGVIYNAKFVFSDLVIDLWRKRYCNQLMQKAEGKQKIAACVLAYIYVWKHSKFAKDYRMYEYVRQEKKEFVKLVLDYYDRDSLMASLCEDMDEQQQRDINEKICKKYGVDIDRIVEAVVFFCRPMSDLNDDILYLYK